MRAAQPKSMRVQECWQGRRSTLPGLRSRCTHPLPCSRASFSVIRHSTCKQTAQHASHGHMSHWSLWQVSPCWSKPTVYERTIALAVWLVGAYKLRISAGADSKDTKDASVVPTHKCPPLPWLYHDVCSAV